ncbi:MAG: in-like serine protease [Chlorobi bacterium]|nr:in-like serine protease [Chlorobiota bacterium]
MHRSPVWFSIALLLLLPRLAHACPQDTSATGNIVVRLIDSGRTDLALGLFQRLKLDVVTTIRLGPLRIYSVRPAAGNDIAAMEAALKQSSLFAWIEPDRVIAMTPETPLHPIAPRRGQPAPSLASGSFPPNDPYFSAQYSLRNRGDEAGAVPGADINISDAWAITEGSKDVVVAIGEEGFQGTHPELTGQFVDDPDQYDLMNNDFPHGTLVAGVIAAKKGNGEGIAGIAPGCRIVLAHSQYGTTLVGVLKALEKVLEWNAAVFTNSWGFFRAPLQPLQEAYDLVARTGRNGLGTLIIFAAGNDARPWVHYPGWYDRFLCVGATTRGDDRWISSNYGREIDLCAPGEDIITTSPGSNYSRVSGTSLAAPIVAGAAALVFSANPMLTADSARAIIEMTCDKVGGYRYDEIREHGSWSPYTGYGRVNAGRAVRMARGIADTSVRLLWPRGKEILHAGDTATIRWRAGRPVRVEARSPHGSRDLAGILPAAADSFRWAPAAADTFQIILRDGGNGMILDSLEAPLMVRDHHYHVAVDTAAPFLALDRMAADGLLSSLTPAPHTFALPFDFAIGEDTSWCWTRDTWGSSPAWVSAFMLVAGSPPTLDPHADGEVGIADFLANDIDDIDSARIGITGTAPDRVAIVELSGLLLDSALYSAGDRAGAHRYARQIRFHERDGSISYHYNRPFDARADRPDTAERGGITIALAANDELLLPFGRLYLNHVPAGSITFTPDHYSPLPEHSHSAIVMKSQRATYGYDVYYAGFISNRYDSVGLRASTDGGATWIIQPMIPPGAQTARLLVPPRYNGPLVVALSGQIDAGWRDTLTVTDHGYTIERTGDASRIGGESDATRIDFATSEEARLVDLPFAFPYFGVRYPSIAISRFGWIEPRPAGGAAEIYARVTAFPKLAADPDSLAPVSYRFASEGGRGVAIVEWDSLSRYSPAGDNARGSAAQIRIYDDGVIDIHLFTPSAGDVPYYAYPVIESNNILLAHPDFTMRPPSPLPLPLGSCRYIPHAPMVGVPFAMPSRGPASLNAIPNPASGDVLLKRNGGGAWNVIITDMVGRVVARLGSGGGEAIIWRTENIPAGIYTAREAGGTGAARVAIIR